MNTLLLGLLLVLVLQNAPTAHGASMDREMCINAFNKHRQKVAFRDQIANMIELRYEWDLEHSSFYRMEQEGIHLGKCVKGETVYRDGRRNMPLMVVLRPNNWEEVTAAYPGSTFASCIKMYCSDQNVDVIGIAFTYSQEPVIHGTPGTACREGYEEFYGLCRRVYPWYEKVWRWITG